MADSRSSTGRKDVLEWFDTWGAELLRYAASRLRDPHIAEDLVQEAFLAAWKNHQQFTGQSSAKTWLIGILRRKLADHYRREHRGTPTADPNRPEHHTRSEHTDDEGMEDSGRPFQFFDQRGHWTVRLEEWPGKRDECVERAEFWTVLRSCISKLPAGAAAAFIFRAMDQLETNQICEMLRVTPSNLGVMLYRGRLALRHCVGKKWFGEVLRDRSRAKAKRTNGS